MEIIISLVGGFILGVLFGNLRLARAKLDHLRTMGELCVTRCALKALQEKVNAQPAA
jgi:uncharacterized membrane protein YhiD involved in acid resistance